MGGEGASAETSRTTMAGGGGWGKYCRATENQFGIWTPPKSVEEEVIQHPRRETFMLGPGTKRLQKKITNNNTAKFPNLSGFLVGQDIIHPHGKSDPISNYCFATIVRNTHVDRRTF